MLVMLARMSHSYRVSVWSIQRHQRKGHNWRTIHTKFCTWGLKDLNLASTKVTYIISKNSIRKHARCLSCKEAKTELLIWYSLYLWTPDSPDRNVFTTQKIRFPWSQTAPVPLKDRTPSTRIVLLWYHNVLVRVTKSSPCRITAYNTKLWIFASLIT